MGHEVIAETADACRVRFDYIVNGVARSVVKDFCGKAERNDFLLAKHLEAERIKRGMKQ